jgi:ERCC4-related helicase
LSLAFAVSSRGPTESSSASKPSNPTPQLPPTVEISPVITSVQPSDETVPPPSDATTLVSDSSLVSTPNLPTDETTALSSDDSTSSSTNQDSLSSPGSDEEPSPLQQGEPEDSQVQESSQETESSHEAKTLECESIPTSFDYTLKLDLGKQIREYQKELAEPGINGENYIVVAPTGSGKTLVAAMVISDHLENKQHEDKKPKVVFIVNTKPLAEQQKKELEKFIPGAQVGCSMGDGGPSISDLLPHNSIIVCTAGKLLDAIKADKVKFDMISLIVIDECHHTKKSSPQANVMLRYLQCKKKNPSKVPQVMGLTASPGAGDNPHLDEKITINHLVNLCALMDATSGIRLVDKHQEELNCNTNKPAFTLDILPSRSEDEPFIQTIVREMREYEKTVPCFKCAFPKWAQEYETIVQQLKQQLELSIKSEYRDQISTLRLLRCYSQALNIYMDLTHNDAISVLEEYKGLPADDSQATPSEIKLKKSLRDLLTNLRKLDPVENPLLNAAKERLIDVFSNKPNSKGILFVQTKKHAVSICKWIGNLPEARQYDIKPRVITGHTRETGSGMTQVEQNEVMTSFRESGCNLLVATSVAEEGLDVPACNLVIRFQHVSNEIAKKQTQGRARAEESEAFTILASNSKKKLQELKNDELLRLVEECMQWFPTGQYLTGEIDRRQQAILAQHQQKIAVRRQISDQNSASDFQMMCKNCKAPACAGSDVYLIDGTFHHAVPDEDFKEKFITKPHKTRHQLAEQMAPTDKIYCAKCDSEWGIMATWPAKSKQFPVIKCKQFIFESNGQLQSIRKWSNAPFQLSNLSVWFESQKKSDDSDSEGQ